MSIPDLAFSLLSFRSVFVLPIPRPLLIHSHPLTFLCTSLPLLILELSFRSCLLILRSPSPPQQVIDVGALDSRGLEQRDYLDRARQYSARLALSVKPAPFLTQPANILAQHLSAFSCSSSSAAAPHILGAPTPKSRDLTMVTALASRCADAVRDVGVDHQEDLVVPFGV